MRKTVAALDGLLPLRQVMDFIHQFVGSPALFFQLLLQLFDSLLEFLCIFAVSFFGLRRFRLGDGSVVPRTRRGLRIRGEEQADGHESRRYLRG